MARLEREVLHPDGRTTLPPDSPQPRPRASPAGAHNPDALSARKGETDHTDAAPRESASALALHGAHAAVRSAVSEPDQALEGMGGAATAAQAQQREVRAAPERPGVQEAAAGEPLAAVPATHQEALGGTLPGSGDAAPAPAGDSVRGTALGGADRNPHTNPGDAAALPPGLPAEVAALAARVTEIAEAQDAAARAAVAQHHQVAL